MNAAAMIRSDGDGGRHVARRRRRWRRWPWWRCRDATAGADRPRRVDAAGAATVLGHRPAHAVVGRVGADGDPAGSAARHGHRRIVDRHVVQARGQRLVDDRAIGHVQLAGGRRIVAPHRRVVRERRPHVEVFAGLASESDRVWRPASTASRPSGARSSAAAGRCRPCRTTARRWGRRARWSGRRRTAAARSRRLRGRPCWPASPDIIAHEVLPRFSVPATVLTPRAVPVPCGPRPCRSARRDRA